MRFRHYELTWFMRGIFDLLESAAGEECAEAEDRKHA